MTQIKTSYNRRSFIKVTAAAGGGMLLGFSSLIGCQPDVVEEEILTMPGQWFDMNGFIKIGDNGVVTILSPNPEIGQNIKTSMPMIVAEELDVDWSKVVVEQAGLDTQKYTRQVAGGSQSIRQGWKSLRTAGATARRMILESASKKWEVPVEELSTDKGIVHHKATSKSDHYGAFATGASDIEVPDEIALKDPKDFKIIGNSKIRNVDGKAIVTGTAEFGMDYEEEGMCIAMVEHPPAFGMILSSFNQDEIKSMPGIIDAMQVDTSFLEKSDWLSKAFKKNSMIAIVGNTTWEVMKAKKALKAKWEYGSEGENTTDHESKLTSLIEEVIEPKRLDGNPKEAFATAAKIIEKTYSAPFLPHNTMSPMNFFADVQADKARFVGPIQLPEIASKSLSEVLEIPLENISIMMTRMGGGFGRRLYGNWMYEAGLISRQVRKPVKLIYSREDDMTFGTYRPAYKVKYRAAIDQDNNLSAFEISGAGIHGGPVWENRFPAGAVANYRAQDQELASNISTGAWRAPKSNFIAGAEQSFLDEIAEAIGQDPLAFRLSLLEKAKSNPIGEDNDYDPERYAGVLQLVKEKSNWDTKISGVHRGLAAYYCHNSYVAQVVDIIIQDDKPIIKKVWNAVDCGIVVNPEGAKNQLEGGAIDGIGHAMYGGITFENGKPIQNNFDKYRLIRHQDAPLDIETFFVDNGIDPTGLGEPGLPPVIGALANALYRATNKRYYNQPFSAEVELLG